MTFCKIIDCLSNFKKCHIRNHDIIKPYLEKAMVLRKIVKILRLQLLKCEPSSLILLFFMTEN